jgi:hypothetical protein
MAITLLRTEVEGKMTNLMFTTNVANIGGKDLTVLETVEVDDELRPISNPTTYEIEYEEESFHTNLRKEAAAREHLMTSHSSDPEWNPEGYSKNMNDD